MPFAKESDFEEALIKKLIEYGWERDILEYCSESELLDNWAKILFENNRDIDRLNDYPLTSGEMQQILEQIQTRKTPLRLNGFINGRSVCIKRDNRDDKEHFEREISLKIYDRQEIAAGQSRYQIVRQPKFSTQSDILGNRRGDLMLLINGMPVIHIELKKSGIPVSEAYNQIEKYTKEGTFSGPFSLVQIFVAMNPEDAVYFANPGPEGKFNRNYYFHWADFNNEPIKDWDKVASSLLSIPMAHQLIGFYTVADNSDGVLKVMRSYQYYAASAISDKVAKTRWGDSHQLGGYVWHTTGSGKTMTSFKAAQLVASSRDADKVIFLMDRIELGTQSLKEYRNFADGSEDVQGTEDTSELVERLKSNSLSDTLIVTSIQKMSNIKEEENGLNGYDINLLNSKRIVFIVDEAHRSTFGEMLSTIKKNFSKAIFFGFTGTPIQRENQKQKNTTSTVFGDELHRYSIADGLRDKNVLRFDPCPVLIFKDKCVRQQVALEKAKASSEKEALADPSKKEVYYRYMDSRVGMAGYENNNGEYVKGIEDYVPKSQYSTKAYTHGVVEDIIDGWDRLSRNGTFHAIFAVSSISEAISYYRLIKEMKPDLKVTALFDSNIDNDDKSLSKEAGMEEIIKDYNERYGQVFTISRFSQMKKDIAARLAHKRPYERMESNQQIDLLIVVDQMLTGFDSKWINSLYLDKMLEYENIIQAFSRTNRLFGPDKPFGIIKWYRKPHTMKSYMERAVKLYSGDKPLGLFVDHLLENLKKMNSVFEAIFMLFTNAGIKNFEKLPEDVNDCKKFVKDFNEFNHLLKAAEIQGFEWGKSSYKNVHTNCEIEVRVDKKTYSILVLRYQELSTKHSRADVGDIPYDLESYITEIDMEIIDADYMNSKFDKYIKSLAKGSGTDIEKMKMELHQTFSTLSQEKQKVAEILLHDIERGDIEIVPGKIFMDYINEYSLCEDEKRIAQLEKQLGIDKRELKRIMDAKPNEGNLNEFGRYDALKESVDRAKAKKYFEDKEKINIPRYQVMQKVDRLLRNVILYGKFDIETYSIKK